MYNIKRIDNIYGDKINSIISNYIDIIVKIEEIEKSMEDRDPGENLVNISSILLVLAHCKGYINDDDLEDIIYKYMCLVNKEINIYRHMSPSLYGGLSNLAFSVYMISKVYPYYKKTLDHLNQIIVENTYSLIDKIENRNSLIVDDYDLISGVSGISIYLSLFKDEYIEKCIRRISKYLVEVINEKNLYGELIPGIHIKCENQYLDEDKAFYKKGTFNFGLAHGICSPLVALSFSYDCGIKVSGHKESIEYILNILNKFKIQDKKSIFWNGVLSFEEFVNFNPNVYCIEPRASWCYGSPGIARSMYLAGKIISNKHALETSKNTFEYLCNPENISNWQLNSPTICHGFSGMLAILNLMSIDENDDTYLDSLELTVKETLKFYDIKNKYLFKNIENLDEKLEYEDNLDFLTGTAGVILSLMSLKKEEVKSVFRLIGLI